MEQNSYNKILKGRYKNQKLPLPVPVHGFDNSTPDRVKESIFQIIHNFAPNNGLIFLCDLFSGSGQIGFEGISRGFFLTSLLN